jgi:hypothetical protein
MTPEAMRQLAGAPQLTSPTEKRAAEFLCFEGIYLDICCIYIDHLLVKEEERLLQKARTVQQWPATEGGIAVVPAFPAPDGYVECL